MSYLSYAHNYLDKLYPGLLLRTEIRSPRIKPSFGEIMTASYTYYKLMLPSTQLAEINNRNTTFLTPCLQFEYISKKTTKFFK